MANTESFATMVRQTFSDDEVMVGMPFTDWETAYAEGVRYSRAGIYSARVTKLDHEGREIPCHGGFIDTFGNLYPSSPFDSLITPAEV